MSNKHILSRAVAALVVFLTVAPSAFANSIIELSSHTISYESGSIDAETLNGDATNVVIKQKSRRGGTILIDQYSLNSTDDGTTTTIESLMLNGVTMITQDQEKVTVEEFSWAGGQIDGNWMDMLIESGQGENPIFSNLGTITANAITGTEDGQTVFTVDSVFINTTDMADNPYKNLPISDLSFEFRNIFIPASVSNDDELRLSMQEMGMDGFRFSVALAGKNVLMSDRINTNMTLLMSADKMADIRMSLGLGTSDLILSEIDRMIATSEMEDVADMYIELMMVGMFFNNMDLIVSDKGVLDILIADYAEEMGVSRDQAVSLMMDGVASAIGVAAPNTYREIAPHLRSFLDQGGSLYVGLNPNQPVPAASLLGIIAIPDQAKDLLGLTFNHQGN